jgi:hypothetical protein
MNIKIRKDKFEKMVIKYLNRDVEPDYSWGPKLHDFYRDDIDRYGSYDFVINDIPSYSYVGEGKQLLIQPHLYERLTNLFGELWVPIFKKWFEDNSGLEVSDVFN